MADKKSITVLMKLERDTKGAIRYQEVGADGTPKAGDEAGAIMGTQYFRKKGFFEALGNTNQPQMVEIVITPK